MVVHLNAQSAEVRIPPSKKMTEMNGKTYVYFVFLVDTMKEKLKTYESRQ